MSQPAHLPHCARFPPSQGPANIEAICLLVELGADVAGVLAAKPVETPLHIAARSGRGDIVDRLVTCPQVGGRPLEQD